MTHEHIAILDVNGDREVFYKTILIIRISTLEN